MSEYIWNNANMLVFFHETGHNESYTCGHDLSLHDALPICSDHQAVEHHRHEDGGAHPGGRRVVRVGRCRGPPWHRSPRGSCEPPCPSRSRSPRLPRTEEHTSELQSLMRIAYAVICLKTHKHNQLQ